MITYNKPNFQHNFKEFLRDLFVIAVSPIMILLGFALYIMQEKTRRDNER